MFIFQPDRYLLKSQIKKYAPYIKGVVLDVGAGRVRRYAGYFQVEKYITLDINPAAQPDILASADSIPLKDKTVDSIICTQVLGDVLEPEKVVKEMARVLKPGGIILLTESFMNELHSEPQDFWRFTKFILQHFFEKANLEIIALEQRGGFFTTLAQNQIRYAIDRFHLYSHQWARLLNPFFGLYSQIMIFLDKIDTSQANRKHSLGWCLVARKK